jgi:hypothetical protein
MGATVSIQEAVEKRLAKKSIPSCKLGRVLLELDAADKAALEYALQAHESGQRDLFSVAWFVDVLKDNGHPVGKTVVSEHLRKACSCVPAKGADL